MFEWIKNKTTLKRKSFSDYDDYRVECRLEFMRDVINEHVKSISYILFYSFTTIIGLAFLIKESLIHELTLALFLVSVLMVLYTKIKFLKSVQDEYLFFINGIEVKELKECFAIIDDNDKKNKRKTKK